MKEIGTDILLLEGEEIGKSQKNQYDSEITCCITIKGLDKPIQRSTRTRRILDFLNYKYGTMDLTD